MPAAPTQFSVQEILNRVFVQGTLWQRLASSAKGGGHPVDRMTSQEILNRSFDPGRNTIAL